MLDKGWKPGRLPLGNSKEEGEEEEEVSPGWKARPHRNSADYYCHSTGWNLWSGFHCEILRNNICRLLVFEGFEELLICLLTLVSSTPHLWHLCLGPLQVRVPWRQEWNFKTFLQSLLSVLPPSFFTCDDREVALWLSRPRPVPRRRRWVREIFWVLW